MKGTGGRAGFFWAGGRWLVAVLFWGAVALPLGPLVLPLVSAFGLQGPGGGAARLLAQESAVPLPPAHWGYQLAELFQAMGCADAWIGWASPLPAGALGGVLADSACAGGEGRQSLAGVRSVWRQALEEELGGGSRGAPRIVVGGVHGGIENGSARLQKAEGWLGGMSVKVQPHRRFALWAEARLTREGIFQGLTAGGAGVRVGPIGALVGRIPLSVGQGVTHRLLNGRRYFDGISVGTAVPARLPGFLRFLGPVSGRWFLSPAIRNDGGFDSWFMTMSMELSPHPRVQLGAARVDRFAAEGRSPFTWGDFWKMLVGKGAFSRSDDSQGTFDVRIRLPAGSRDLTTYASVGFEDLVAVKDDPSLLVGGLLPLVVGGGVLSLRYEYEAFGSRAAWCPGCDFKAHWWYQDPSFWGLYAANGTFLGSELGGYGAAHRVQAQFFSGWTDRRAFRMEVELFREERETTPAQPRTNNRLSDRWPGVRKGIRMESAVRPATGIEVAGALLLTSTAFGGAGFVSLEVRVLDVADLAGVGRGG